EAGEFGLVGAEQRLAHDRMDAVGADQRIAADVLAIPEGSGYAFGRRIEAGAAHTELDRVRIGAQHRLAKHLLQIGAVHGVMRGAVAGAGAAEILHAPALIAVPDAEIDLAGDDADAVERLAEAELAQHARAIGGNLDTGTKFAQRRRLIEDFD